MTITHPTYIYLVFGLMSAACFGGAVFFWHRKAEAWRTGGALAFGILLLYLIPSMQRQGIKLEGTILKEYGGLLLFEKVWSIDLTKVQRIEITAYKEGKKNREIWMFQLISGERRNYKPSVLWIEHSNAIMSFLPKHIKVTFAKTEG